MNHTYRKVHQIAQQKGMSIRRLCEKAGVNYPTVTNWKRSEPKQFKLMQALMNVDPEQKQLYTLTVKTNASTRKHALLAFDESDALHSVRYLYERNYPDELVADVVFE